MRSVLALRKILKVIRQVIRGDKLVYPPYPSSCPDNEGGDEGDDVGEHDEREVEGGVPD